ncbi:MAG: hypothetical protein V4558_14390 [Gemmatimonadota bacterium]
MDRNIACVAIALVLAASGCAENPALYGPGEGKVQATNALVFTPATVLTTANHDVTFSFGSTAHSIMFDPKSGVPEDVPPSSNTSVTRRFSGQGPFSYHCGIHPSMTGTVNVYFAPD